MIIVSQDKCSIINFDNLDGLIIGERKGEKGVQVAGVKNDDYLMLGTYATEERAKEVLQEIINTYKFNKCEAVGQKNAVFKMPKE